MKLRLTDDLQQHLGLISLTTKGSVASVNTEPVIENEQQTSEVTIQPQTPKPQLEKNEFRLLVKILQAIGHECQFDQIEHSNNQVIYHHPIKDLVFDDINSNDDPKTMHLSSLRDMNSNPKLKRAVWEKLKTMP